jgi:translation initiation factor IF-1
MVKNSGGNKSKRAGRKFSAPQADKSIRLSESEEEIYAYVSKLLGNGMFHAIDTDHKERLCIMRNKFKGRGKRDNTVSVGSWVLIGKRIWEGGSSSKPKCDLLEVYNDIEMAKLKKSGDPIFSKLRVNSDNIAGAATDKEVEFEFNDEDELATEEYKNIINDMVNKKKTRQQQTADSVEKVSSEEMIENSECEGGASSSSRKETQIKSSRNNVITVSTSNGDGELCKQQIDIDDI